MPPEQQTVEMTVIPAAILNRLINAACDAHSVLGEIRPLIHPLASGRVTTTMTAIKSVYNEMIRHFDNQETTT